MRGRAQHVLSAVVGIFSNLTKLTCFRRLPRFGRAQDGLFKTDRKLWKTSAGVQYRSPSLNPLMMLLSSCVRVHAPSRLSSTAEHDGPSARRPPRWGRFAGGFKKIPARNGLVFPMQRRLGVTKRQACNLAKERRTVRSIRHSSPEHKQFLIDQRARRIHHHSRILCEEGGSSFQQSSTAAPPIAE
jgi:hypothetical protein